MKTESKVNTYNIGYEVNYIYLYKEFASTKEVFKGAHTAPPARDDVEESTETVDDQPLTLVVKIKMESSMR